MLTNHNQDSQLDSWQSHMREALSTQAQLQEFLGKEISETSYPIFIPQKFAQKIKEAGVGSPLWLQFVPDEKELNIEGLKDPIGDHLYAQEGGIIHRYPNRILFSPTEVCPIQCRYCFRKNELHQQDDIFKPQIKKLVAYLRGHPEVEEVILTGGDPLILSHKKLESYFKELSQISTVKMIRLHSRTPVILPERIDSKFVELIKNYSKKFDLITLVIHTNHTSEWSPLFLQKLHLLRTLPLQLLSQSVLLKGVNDCAEVLALLFKMLTFNGVHPYYLHHPDNVRGASHFRLSLEEGRKIYYQLKRKVSGFMLPHYVVELPNGKGKALAFNSHDFVGTSTWMAQDGSEVRL